MLPVWHGQLEELNLPACYRVVCRKEPTLISLVTELMTGHESVRPTKSFAVACLKGIGGFTLTAFLTCFLPFGWIDQCTQWLGFEPFPDHPIAIYLARHLSMFYGFAGGAILVVALDIERYRPLVSVFGFAAILMGCLQAVLDLLSALPIWWTIMESGSTIFGGLFLFWLYNYKESDSTS